MSIYNTVIKSGGGTQIIQIPSAATTTFSYDGTQKSLVLSGYDSSLMTARNISATAAGEYTAIFSLKDISSTCWSDNTTTDKTISWVINKRQSNLTLSKQSVTLNKDNLSDTVSIITYTGDGILTASSSDTDIVNVSLNNNVITISSVSNSVGSAIVTVSAIGTNYTDISVDIDVLAQFAGIYGASWDGTSTTAWTRTDAAANFSDPVPYVSGATSYSSPFDNIMPWSGMTVSERTGGTMVAIPKFWYKLTQTGNAIKVQIANESVDGFSVAPAHLRRGSATMDSDVVYIGRYHCASDYKSKTGTTPLVNITRSTARSGIHTLGNSIFQYDFAMRFTLWLLYIVEFADWNSQAKIGYGCGNDSNVDNMGYTDNMPYHTGTTKSNRTTYGLGTQYRNIEGLWDNVMDWMDGCYYDNNGLNIIMNPRSFSDSSNGISIGIPSSSSYPSAFTVKNVSGTFPTFIPSASDGSESTYSCDGWYAYTPIASYPCLYVGGYFYQSLDNGLFLVVSGTSSSSSRVISCRLMELT